MKIGNKVILTAKTQKGKNLLGPRGNTGTITQDIRPCQCFFGALGVLIKFDREPKRPLKVIEDTLASLQNDRYRDYLYNEENDMWIQIPSSDFELIII